jgi:cell division protein FtsB
MVRLQYALHPPKVAFASPARRLGAGGVFWCASIACMSRAAITPPKLNLLELLLTVLLALGSLQLVALLGLAVLRHLHWQEDLAKLQQQNKQLAREIKGMQARAQRAQNDPVYLEQLARQQGMVGKDETILMPDATNTTN